MILIMSHDFQSPLGGVRIKNKKTKDSCGNENVFWFSNKKIILERRMTFGGQYFSGELNRPLSERWTGFLCSSFEDKIWLVKDVGFAKKVAVVELI